MGPESNEPSSAVKVRAWLSLLTTWRVVPTFTLKANGSYRWEVIVTVTGAREGALVVGGAVVAARAVVAVVGLVVAGAAVAAVGAGAAVVVVTSPTRAPSASLKSSVL